MCLFICLRSCTRLRTLHSTRRGSKHQFLAKTHLFTPLAQLLVASSSPLPPAQRPPRPVSTPCTVPRAGPKPLQPFLLPNTPITAACKAAKTHREVDRSGTCSRHQNKSHSEHTRPEAQTTNAMQAVAALTEACARTDFSPLTADTGLEQSPPLQRRQLH